MTDLQTTQKGSDKNSKRYIVLAVAIIIAAGFILYLFPPKIGLDRFDDDRISELMSGDTRPSTTMSKNGLFSSWYEGRYMLFDEIYELYNPVGEVEYEIEFLNAETLMLVPYDTFIYAPCDGYVTEAGYNEFFGNYIKIHADSDMYITLSHMSGYSNMWMNGESLKRGQQLGYSGQSGNCTDGDRTDSVPWPALGITVEYKDNYYYMDGFIEYWEK